LAPADWLHRGEQIGNLDGRLEMLASTFSQAQIDAFGSALRVWLQLGEGRRNGCRWRSVSQRIHAAYGQMFE